MLEDLLGQKVIVVSKEFHPKYKHLNVHYVGTWESVPLGEVKLSGWNDRIFCYDVRHDSLGLDTRPTKRSKEVIIPWEKVLHIHTLNEKKLINDDGIRGEVKEKYVFHLCSEGDR